MGKIVKGAAVGAGLGATLGTAVPVIGNAVGAVAGAIGGAVVGVFEGIFSSKKHYHLYYFETADGTWKFVMDGHPSQVKPKQKEYIKTGYATVLVRNKDGKYQPGELAPKNPPGGTVANKPATPVNIVLIVAIVAGFGLFYFLIIRRKRKR
jgi:hypothetical protein